MKRINYFNFYSESEQNLYYSSSRIDLSYAGLGLGDGYYHEGVEDFMSRHNANVCSLLKAY